MILESGKGLERAATNFTHEVATFRVEFHVSLEGVVAFSGVFTVRAVPGDAHFVCQSAVCGE